MTDGVEIIMEQTGIEDLIKTILEFATRFLTTYFAVYGVIILIGFGIMVAILISEYRDERKKHGD